MGQYARLISRHTQSCTLQHHPRVPVMPQLKCARMKRLSLCISEKAPEQVAAPHSLNGKKNAPIISPYPNNILCTFQMETTA